jgi:hypothetical protein
MRRVRSRGSGYPGYAEIVHKAGTLQARIDAGEADPISDWERASAARIRIAVDKKRKRETPEWIRKLAES